MVRFTQTKNKWAFFKANIFDLLAIIPFDAFFTLFRISRANKILKLLRFVRIIGFSVQFKRNIDKFLNTNGFIYLMTFTLVLIMISAGIYALAEDTNFGNALWWPVVTVTTVGYGDISPKTEVGRSIAIVLMFLGIGLIGTIPVR
ncbi:potassium channel family protein [Fructobacillus durionis]|uniref:potassium channel family protein n=1 Tax=Fructobacillus durionis TaxID=283737 RepID=UPI00244EDD61|nr:potassium channel family protein [Fructobacillus durionis]